MAAILNFKTLEHMELQLRGIFMLMFQHCKKGNMKLTQIFWVRKYIFGVPGPSKRYLHVALTAATDSGAATMNVSKTTIYNLFCKCLLVMANKSSQSALCNVPATHLKQKF